MRRFVEQENECSRHPAPPASGRSATFPRKRQSKPITVRRPAVRDDHESARTFRPQSHSRAQAARLALQLESSACRIRTRSSAPSRHTNAGRLPANVHGHAGAPLKEGARTRLFHPLRDIGVPRHSAMAQPVCRVPQRTAIRGTAERSSNWASSRPPDSIPEATSDRSCFPESVLPWGQSTPATARPALLGDSRSVRNRKARARGRR